jgi:hypothetical protein
VKNGSRGRATGEKGRTKDAARCKKVGREVGRKMQQTKKIQVEGAADEKAGGEADRKGGGCI